MNIPPAGPQVAVALPHRCMVRARELNDQPVLLLTMAEAFDLVEMLKSGIERAAQQAGGSIPT